MNSDCDRSGPIGTAPEAGPNRVRRQFKGRMPTAKRWLNQRTPATPSTASGLDGADRLRQRANMPRLARGVSVQRLPPLRLSIGEPGWRLGSCRDAKRAGARVLVSRFGPGRTGLGCAAFVEGGSRLRMESRKAGGFADGSAAMFAGRPAPARWSGGPHPPSSHDRYWKGNSREVGGRARKAGAFKGHRRATHLDALWLIRESWVDRQDTKGPSPAWPSVAFARQITAGERGLRAGDDRRERRARRGVALNCAGPRRDGTDGRRHWCDGIDPATRPHCAR
jgi:hypothetical protein